MFFRKSKHIKELEKEVSDLRYKLKLLQLRNWELETNKLETKTVGASVNKLLPCYEDFGKKEIGYRLGQELVERELIKYSKEYDPLTDTVTLKGMIRIVRS